MDGRAAASPAYASVIVPTYNRADRIGYCLAALDRQDCTLPFEIIVVNDGSTDNTIEFLAKFPTVRVISQMNAGPAAARNRGVRAAAGEIVLFTDDDCEPFPNWLTEMLKPFSDPEVVGTKGIYRSRQPELIARFVQLEYEGRYRLMARQRVIDFVDTYSAAFRRDQFMEIGGYDTSFPVACCEDSELSYRMSARGWRMVFVQTAIVWHQHPTTSVSYLRRKVKFAFWRIPAIRATPGKMVRDSHHPQLMKLQLLFLPLFVAGLLSDLYGSFLIHPLSLVIVGLFTLSTIPFALSAFRKDPIVGLLSPPILAARSCAQLIGITGGLLLYALRGLARTMEASALTRKVR
jgi:cellulose synthase/poly-beta-1,6-N-acetylglucosamine synthase-like glycosyltransferase